jgi:aryl-alcohol dehydrogenase-like predicted oxidoreductase
LIDLPRPRVKRASPRGRVGGTIPGTTKRARFEENAAAVDVELTADDLREIEGAASKITVHGARYPEHLARLVDR